jgi:hypothetical protein
LVFQLRFDGLDDLGGGRANPFHPGEDFRGIRLPERQVVGAGQVLQPEMKPGGEGDRSCCMKKMGIWE